MSNGDEMLAQLLLSQCLVLLKAKANYKIHLLVTITVVTSVGNFLFLTVKVLL